MFKYLLPIVLLTGCSVSKWHKEFLISTTKQQLKDTSLLIIQKDYDVLFASSLASNGQVNYTPHYFIVASKNGVWHQLSYVQKAYYSRNETRDSLIVRDFPKKSGEMILKTFIQNKFWNIEDMDESCPETKAYPNCHIPYHPNRKQLMMVYKGKAAIKQYVDPELLETSACCPGNPDRLVFIKCDDALRSFSK